MLSWAVIRQLPPEQFRGGVKKSGPGRCEEEHPDVPPPTWSDPGSSHPDSGRPLLKGSAPSLFTPAA